MPTYQISYGINETLPSNLEKEASALGLSPEQLIKRFISTGMAKLTTKESKLDDAEAGTSIRDFFEKNGVLVKK